MDNNKTLYTIIVHSENIAGLLNQVTAVFTRRQINIESLNVSASSIKGVHKYTITCWTTPDIVEKVVRQIEKRWTLYKHIILPIRKSSSVKLPCIRFLHQSFSQLQKHQKSYVVMEHI